MLDEEAEALRGRAFTVVSPAARVDTYTAGKELLVRSPLGGLVSATIMGNGNRMLWRGKSSAQRLSAFLSRLLPFISQWLQA